LTVDSFHRNKSSTLPLWKGTFNKQNTLDIFAAEWGRKGILFLAVLLYIDAIKPPLLPAIWKYPVLSRQT